MRLPEICEIQLGYTARGRVEPSTTGGIYAIQLRDLTGAPTVEAEGVIRADFGEIAARYFVSPGDVLFRSRGERTTAAIVGASFHAPAIAISPLIILRPDPPFLVSDYLAWTLNQAHAQRHFDLAAQGASLRMVPRSSLDSLEIDVPDIDTQRAIAAADRLAEEERRLARDAADVKRRLVALRLVNRAARPHDSLTKERA